LCKNEPIEKGLGRRRGGVAAKKKLSTFKLGYQHRLRADIIH
tara:strand:+ start:747 stop:872 length:126 start_codon:yes stop_codon:yes gene_type:complete